MRIHNENDDKTISQVTIFLTLKEARDMSHQLETLLNKPITQGEHIHISNDDFSKDVTIALYDPNASLDGWHERSKRVIEKDE